MKKTVKHYVVKMYPAAIGCDKVHSEVETRDPNSIQNDGKMNGFYYYDRVIVSDRDQTYYDKREKESGYYLFGKRVSIEDMKELYPNKREWFDSLLKAGYKDICVTQTNNLVTMSDNDMTYDEFLDIDSKKREKRAAYMFRQLKKHIGENVECSIWLCGRMVKIYGILTEVSPYNCVKIVMDNGSIVDFPFIDKGFTIRAIITKGHIVLYINPYVEEAYNCKDDHDVCNGIRAMFGKRIGDKYEARLNKEQKNNVEKIRK